jgi:hypothetical protein
MTDGAQGGPARRLKEGWETKSLGMARLLRGEASIHGQGRQWARLRVRVRAEKANGRKFEVSLLSAPLARQARVGRADAPALASTLHRRHEGASSTSASKGSSVIGPFLFHGSTTIPSRGCSGACVAMWLLRRCTLQTTKRPAGWLLRRR